MPIQENFPPKKEGKHSATIIDDKINYITIAPFATAGALSFGFFASKATNGSKPITACTESFGGLAGGIIGNMLFSSKISEKNSKSHEDVKNTYELTL